MKTKIMIVAICFFVGVMGTGLAWADGNGHAKTEPGMEEIEVTCINVQNAPNIIGMRVKNDQGKELGWVDELIFTDDGSLSYLVVSRGGFQSSATLNGVGGELVPIPFQSIRNGFHVSENWVNIPVTIGQFDTAPRFLSYELANMHNLKWEGEARAYFKD